MSTGPLGAKCSECPFSKDGQPPHTPVLAEKPYKKAKGLLVGECPGSSEVELGRPFCGPTGQELDRELEKVKLYRPMLLVLNAMLCQPTTKKDSDMRRACDACRPAFLHQIRKVPPNTPTMALGKWSVYQLTGKVKGVAAGHGFIDYEYNLTQAKR